MRRSLVLLTGFACAVCAGAIAFAADAPTGHPQYGTWGYDTTAMDKSVKPGDDFFLYANGNWYKTAVIPPDRSSTGSFQDLSILSENRTKDIIATLDAKPYDQLTDEEKKLRDLYDAFTDQKQIDAAGLTPAKPDLDYIESLQTPDDVATAMGRPDLGLDGPFGGGIGVDPKNPMKYQVALGQTGLGMPDRDYYLKTDPESVKIQDAYKAHLAKVFAMVGLSDPDKRAAAVYDLEDRLAKVMWSRAQNRNIDAIVNPMTLTQVEALAPKFPWDAYFKASTIPTTNAQGERIINVSQKSAFPDIAQVFADTPVPVWRDYLIAHYIHSYSDVLPSSFDQEDFAFYGTVLQG
ncbi:MAG TPA: M13 family metallopeptidase N-terminal domain-containing protein, partial [Rhizomicrobium sp.]|nr:M13 family metallopeptidase N-terminal domain-containing protein [Rhizomicrobium sp.]